MEDVEKRIKPIVEDFKAELDILGKKPKTILNYASTVKNFLLFVFGKGYRLEDINEDHVKEWFKHLRTQGVTHRSLARHLHALRAFFKLELKQELTLPAPKYDEKLPDWLTVEEVQKLISVASKMEEDEFLKLRNKTMLMLAYDCGLRKHEIPKLDIDDVDLERGMVRIRGKGGREEYVHIIEDSTIAYLRKYIEERVDKFGTDEKALFVSLAGNRIHENTVDYVFKKAKNLAEITKKGSVHLLRHCLHKDTRIVTSDGITSAEEVYFLAGDQLITVDLDKLALTSDKLVNKTYHHANGLLRIWASGRELICTPEHRLFTLTENGIEEIQAKDMKVGNYVLGVRRIYIPNRSKKLPKELWRLIGYFIGDGHFHESGRAVELSDIKEEFLEFYKEIAEKADLRAKINKERHQLIIYSCGFMRFLAKIRLDCKSKERRVPAMLFSATDEEIAEFIAGFVDAEATVKDNCIRIFNTNKELLKDIQMLLLYFGIHSTLGKRTRYVKTPSGQTYEKHVIYKLCVSGDIDKFMKTIPTLKRVELTNKKWNLTGECIPIYPILKKIYERRKKAGKKIGRLSYFLQRKLTSTKKRIEKEILPLIRDEPEYEFIKKLVENNDVMWLKVTRIEKSGGYSKYVKEKDLGFANHLVYDFETAKTHTLITDGIISHNSRATHLLMWGWDIREVQEHLRHKRLTTTAIYTHITHEWLGKKKKETRKIFS